MKNIAVWLDDQYIPEGKPQYIDEWKCCRSVEEFTKYVEDYYLLTSEFPKLFALTHDLCTEHVIAESKRFPAAPIFYTKFKTPTGLHAVRWLIEFSLTHNIPIGRIALHGDNRKGIDNMMYELKKHKEKTNDNIPVFTMNWNKSRIN